MAMKKMAVADAETRGLIYEDGASSAAPGGGFRVLGLSHRSATAAFAALAAAVAVLAVANLTLLLGAPPAADATAAAAAAAAPSFRVSFPAEARAEALDGRLLVLLSRHATPEPRFAVGFMSSHATVQVYGRDFDSMLPGEAVVLDGSTDEGDPLFSTGELPPGDYYVQAVLHRYETFELSTGHTVQLPPGDGGDGQKWNRAPGNLYSMPQQVAITGEPGQVVALEADQTMPPIPPAADTEWVKHVTIRSELLSEFFGREVEIGAHVLLPRGWAEHPEARYPLLLNHGHYPADFTPAFRTAPPDDTLDPDSRAFSSQRRSFDFYQRWVLDPDLPRYLAVTVQHPTPYFDDSCEYNSRQRKPVAHNIDASWLVLHLACLRLRALI
jgi:hypothetical protein